MQSADTRPLLFQRVLNKLAQAGKNNRGPRLSSLVFGFLAHAFAFTNKLVNHDVVLGVFSIGVSVVSGLW